MFFSLAYLAADSSTILRTIARSPLIQSETTLPLRAVPLLEAHQAAAAVVGAGILSGGTILPKPSCCRRFWSMLRFSMPQRTCSPVIGFLPNLPCAVRTASTVIIAAARPRFQSTVPTSFGSLCSCPCAIDVLLDVLHHAGSPCPPRFRLARSSRSAAPSAASVSISEPAHQLPTILSRGKPTFCAVLSAVAFITPQPQRITQSGWYWRICSHCDCCSLPGCGTGIIFSSKPRFVGLCFEHRMRFLAVGRVVIQQHDLLALELVRAAFLVADELDDAGGRIPVVGHQRKHPREHAAVDCVGAPVADRDQRDLVGRGLVDQA